MKKILFITLFICTFLLPVAHAGELREKPFKDVYGKTQYEYSDDSGRTTTIKEDPNPDVYGKTRYHYADDEGNSGTISEKPNRDVYGNKVYEDKED